MNFEPRKLLLGSLFCGLVLLALVGLTGVEVADANQCAAQCHSAHQSCMIARKGNPSCNAALTSCLQSCR